jgi:antitoxin component YwqK of YwqJK toxin-antitoxin module
MKPHTKFFKIHSLSIFFLLAFFTQLSYGIQRQFEIVKDPETGKDKQVYITGLKTNKRSDGSVLYVMSLKDGYQDGPTIRYYDDGAIQQEKSYRNNLADGSDKRYFKNGQLRMIAGYEKGLKQGEQIHYFDTQNGEQSIRIINQYDQGLKSGEQRHFNQDGVLIHSVSYRINFEDNNEMKHGPEIRYFDNKKVRVRKFFVDGRLHGLRQSYHENGQLQQESCHISGREQKGLNKCKGKEGKEIIQVQFADGSVEHEYEIEGGKLNGFNKTYFENKQLSWSRHFANDRQTGEEKQYDKEGVLLASSNWQDGLKHGVGKWFFSNGTLSDEFNYSNGKLQGEGFKYHSNGNVYISGFYISGKKNGHFKYYTPENKIVQDLNYKDGFMQGISQFHQKGVLREECEFKAGSLVDCKEVDKQLISL